MRSSLKRSAGVVIGTTGLAILFAFQNCSPVKFAPVDPDTFNKQSVPGSAYVTAGDEDSFPPLKLVFVVDNSGTMLVNQINLSTSFAKLFEGTNASNLTPFESTAFVFNTAQKSVDKDATLFSKLPDRGPANLGGYSYTTLQSLRGTSTTQGKIPGDLVGFGVETVTTGDKKTVTYVPSPVIGFTQGKTGVDADVELGVTKTRDGSVASFAQAFSQRISILDPSRSEIDPVTRAGILDPIVDKESGLCSLARILKKNDGYLNRGDLAAFVIVSDEDDSDPSGANCIEQYSDYQGTEDLIDGRCDQPMTTLSYRPVNPNPQIETCKVSYRSGFSYLYKYSMPTTVVSYSNMTHSYDRPRVSVAYYTYSYSAPNLQTRVNYYTSAPTYELKTTNVVYYKEVESCDTRDGIKVNCTYSYPQSTTTLQGAFNGNCSAFVAGKLPAGAVYTKSGYLPACSIGTPIAKSGACPNSPDVQNCQLNYSTTTTAVVLSGVQSDTQTCVQFAAGRLPANAVYTDATKQPTCTDASTVVTTAGKCPQGLANCVQNYVAASPKILFGVPANCSTIVTGQLGTHGVYTDAGKTPVCTATSTVAGSASGWCPATQDPNKLNCQNGTAVASKTLDSSPVAGQTCEQFASGKLGAYAIYGNSSNPISCVAGTPKALQVTGAQNYSNGAWPSYDPALNSVCTPDLENKIRSVHSITAAPTACTVSAITTGETVLQAACTNMTAASVCTATSGKKGCATTVIPGGSPFLPTVTEHKNGTFTCSTLCSATSFCAAMNGTVADNYDSCAVTPKAPVVKRTFTSELVGNNSVCMDSETKIVTRGPYRATGRKITYVAGSLSESGDPAALSKYIRSRSEELFGSELPALSVFVRQPGDAMGTNGSLGVAYNSFADSMGGQKRSVLADADGYASSLQSLGQVVRTKLERSFFVPAVGSTQKIIRAYHRKKGTTSWGLPIDPSQWSASGGTVTLGTGFVFEYGDEFRFDYQ